MLSDRKKRRFDSGDVFSLARWQAGIESFAARAAASATLSFDPFKIGFIVSLSVIFLLFERFSIAIALLSVALLVSLGQLRQPREEKSPVRAPRRRPLDEPLTAAEPEDASTLADVIPLNNAFAPAWKDLDDFLQATLDVIKTRFVFQTANIFLRGADARTFIQRAYATRTDAVARLAVIKSGHGLVGWVAANKRPLLVSNLRHEGRSMGYYRTAGEQVGSFAAAPILVNGETVGVIALDHDKPDAFPTPETEEALSAVAALLARVIGADETLEQRTRELDRLREARRIFQAAYDASDLDGAAAAVLKELVTLAEFHSLACYLLDENGLPSRRSAIGFHGIGAYNIKEPVAMRAVRQALHQCSPYRVEGAALSAQYRGARGTGLRVPELLIAFPILQKGEPLGALVVETLEKKTLDDRIEGILTDVVSGLGGAFLRVYRAAVAEGTARVESELTRFSGAVIEVEEPSQVWERSFNLLLERTGAQGVAAYRRSPNGFTLESSRGCSPSETHIPENATLVGWAALAGRAVMTTREDRRRPPVEEGESYLACAVGSGQDLRAVIVLVSGDKTGFDVATREWMESFAQTLAPVLGKADRMLQARDALERDAFSGLYNEPGLVARIKAMRSAGDVGVLVLRIDNNEDLIAAFGWSATRTFTRKVGNVVETILAGRGIAARLESGRFAVATTGDIAALRESFLRVLTSSSISMLQDLPVSYSIAYARSQDGVRAEELLDAAESRLASLESRATTVASVA